MNMVKVVRNYFMLFAFLSMLLLTACGGGGGDGDNNGNKSAENDYNTATVNSNLVGEWYLYSESGKIVKANDSGKTDLLNLKSNGNFNLVGYFSIEYSNYIQTNNNIEDNTTGTWSYSNGKLYLTSDGETYWTYASISNNTLTIRNPDSNDSLVYKKSTNSSSGNSNTNNDNNIDNKLFSSLVTNLKPDNLYEYEFESNCVITGKNFGKTKKDLYLTSSFNKYQKKIDSSTVKWTDTQISFPIPIEDLEKSITYESNIYVTINHNNQLEDIGYFYFYRLKLGDEILKREKYNNEWYIYLEDENIIPMYRTATEFYLDSVKISKIIWSDKFYNVPIINRDQLTHFLIPNNLEPGKYQLIVKIRDKIYETNCYYEILNL